MAVLHNILALDIGERRVGVAQANDFVRLSSPIKTLIRSDSFFEELGQIIEENEISMIVVGLPKNLSGKDTDQTRLVREFANEISLNTELPIHFEDEALSSVRAEETLKKSNKAYPKSAVDSLAACYILDDFLAHNKELKNA